MPDDPGPQGAALRWLHQCLGPSRPPECLSERGEPPALIGPEPLLTTAGRRRPPPPPPRPPANMQRAAPAQAFGGPVGGHQAAQDIADRNAALVALRQHPRFRPDFERNFEIMTHIREHIRKNAEHTIRIIQHQQQLWVHINCRGCITKKSLMFKRNTQT